MRITLLVFLPWVVFGLLSLVQWWSTWINVTISFLMQVIYFLSLYIIGLFTDYDEVEKETAIERAKKVIG